MLLTTSYPPLVSYFLGIVIVSGGKEMVIYLLHHYFTQGRGDSCQWVPLAALVASTGVGPGRWGAIWPSSSYPTPLPIPTWPSPSSHHLPGPSSLTLVIVWSHHQALLHCNTQLSGASSIHSVVVLSLDDQSRDSTNALGTGVRIPSWQLMKFEFN